VDLLAEAEAMSRDLNVDRAVVLGDLVVAVLPAAIADAARELLTRSTKSDQYETPPEVSDGVSDPHSPQFKVMARIPPGCDLFDEESAGGSPG
jgi:hypothetical protein